ncbi:MAG: hypothetical protein ACPGTS_00110 [Minisyncoccia bacterium]
MTAMFSTILYFTNIVEYKIWHTAMIFFACYPYKIGKHVYSIFGGYNLKGSIYSIFSVYQNAEKNAFSLLGGFYQRANKIAVIMIGLSFFQVSIKSVHFFGLSFLQFGFNDVKESEAIQVCTISFYQGSEKISGQVFGIKIFN